MPYEVTYDSERDCIEAWVDGLLDMRVVKEFLEEVARVISTSGCKRVLDDLRGAELALSITTLYFASRLVPEAGIPASIRSAIVVAEKDWSRYSFLEMSAQNQGQIVKMFVDSDAARRWLMEGSDGPVVSE